MTISHTESIIPIRDPDQTRNVNVRRVSGRESWTVHAIPKQARRETENTTNGWWWKNHGKRWCFRYRINIYLKAKNEPT